VGEPAASPDLMVQLPYFAARIAVFAVAVAVFAVLGFVLIYAVLFGLVVAGVLTYPLGRMQKRAARRAAAARRSAAGGADAGAGTPIRKADP
jgi:hypothetical protein